VSSKVNEYVIADAMAQLKVQTSCLDAPKQVQSCFQTTKSLSQNQNQNHRISVMQHVQNPLHMPSRRLTAFLARPSEWPYQSAGSS